MIAVDTSALVAIALKEPEAKAFTAIIRGAQAKVGGPTVTEAAIVIGTKGGEAGLAILHEILTFPSVTVEPFEARHAAAAHEAHLRYGRGRHPAKLNICDCFSYAIAACDDLPLLFKGDDFRLTDIRPALP